MLQCQSNQTENSLQIFALASTNEPDTIKGKKSDTNNFRKTIFITEICSFPNSFVHAQGSLNKSEAIFPLYCTLGEPKPSGL